MTVIDQAARNQSIIANAVRPEVVVGLTATCPYGLAACWGGAYGGLKKLVGVETVRPIADNAASVAFLYMNHDGLPDLANWPKQFTQATNGSYAWRGVEITLTSVVQITGGRLLLPADAHRPDVLLAPLHLADKVQIDQLNGVPNPLPTQEANAYADLLAKAVEAPPGTQWMVTGPILQTSSGFCLEVRRFQ